jgi:hypothetical protein
LGLGASERQVDHLISRLCAVGFMEVLRSDEDRRVRILKPTERMLEHDRDWLAAHHAPLTVLCPHNDYSLVMQRDPAIAATDVARLRTADHMVLVALLHAALSDPDHPHPAVPYADVGDRFGVSRTQVREILAAAEAIGLVKLQARGGHRVEIPPDSGRATIAASPAACSCTTWSTARRRGERRSSGPAHRRTLLQRS